MFWLLIGSLFLKRKFLFFTKSDTQKKANLVPMTTLLVTRLGRLLLYELKMWFQKGNSNQSGETENEGCAYEAIGWVRPWLPVSTNEFTLVTESCTNVDFLKDMTRKSQLHPSYLFLLFTLDNSEFCNTTPEPVDYWATFVLFPQITLRRRSAPPDLLTNQSDVLHFACIRKTKISLQKASVLFVKSCRLLFLAGNI